MSRHVIIFSNQKGGVGKTTLTRELGIYLSSVGQRVLLVDCDPQGNLSKSLIDGQPAGGLYDALEGGELQLLDVGERLHLLAGDFRLSAWERRLVAELDGYVRVKELLARGAFQSYELILLDTPPSLGVLTANALAAAEYLVIPMNPTLYSLQGTNDLLATVSKVRKTLNPTLRILGVIVNCFDAIPVITRQIRQEITDAFGEKVFPTVLSKSIKLEEAIASKRGVIHHRRLEKSRVREEVAALGAELLRRVKEEAHHGLV
jgi:chromosome partitioning protein